MSDESHREWLSQKKFAERFGYSPRTVSRWVNDLNMPHVGSGKNCRIDVAAAMRWLNAGGPAAELRLRGRESRVGMPS